jgi:hypothetical protein
MLITKLLGYICVPLDKSEREFFTFFVKFGLVVNKKLVKGTFWLFVLLNGSTVISCLIVVTFQKYMEGGKKNSDSF